MELSQSALAVLLLCGFPLGVVFNVTYKLTDLESYPNHIFGKILINLKDFVFLLLAAVVTVLMVYYINDGDYRFHSIAGILAGYLVSDLTIGKLIIRIRNTVISAVVGFLSAPLIRIWGKTIGTMLAKAENAALVRNTKSKTEYMMLLASNGFENSTEAKEWKKMKSNGTQQ